MRRVVFVLVALAFVPTATLAEHPSHLEPRCDDEVFFHLCVDVQDLGPGDEIVRNLLSPEGPLRAGWVYIIYGGTQGEGTVIADLAVEGRVVESFVWPAGAFHKNSTKIQETGNYTLTLRNPGETEVRYAFYYDQSCNCAGKLIPLPGGFVLFNWDLPADRDVTVRFPTIDGWVLQGAAARLRPDATGAAWPGDFQLLVEAEQRGKGWLELPFKTKTKDTYYVFLEAREGATPDAPVQLTPQVIIPEEPVESPGAAGAVLLIALLGLLGLVARRRA